MDIGHIALERAVGVGRGMSVRRQWRGRRGYGGDRFETRVSTKLETKETRSLLGLGCESIRAAYSWSD
jgi:hypothetical protein